MRRTCRSPIRLNGINAAAFNIDPVTGVVTLKAVADYQTQPSYSFNVVASDGTVSSTQAVTVAITDVAPTITSGNSAAVVEGTAITVPVYTATATDVVGSPLTYSLSGTNAAAFSIDSATGVVTLKAVADFETQASYSFNVVASDGTLSSSQAVTLAVTDLHRRMISSAATVNVNEGVAANIPVYTVVAADPGGGTVTYSLAGTDAAAFTINATTGVVTINNVPDFETKNSYSFNVKASDPSGQFNTEAVTLAVNDLPPVISSAATANINEGVAVGTTVVYAAVAADPGGGTVTYSLTGADAAAFTINATTGIVTINNVPDFETKNSYSFTVKASDPSGQFNTEAVTISVNDLPPVISSAATANVYEGVAGGTTVYTAVAADPGGGTVTYSLTGSDAAAFTINASTGVVTINTTPDFETKAAYNFTVKASDLSGAFNTEAVTLAVNDLPPVISSAATVNVNEGVAANSVVYTAVAADPAGGTVTYSLTGTDARAFFINSATGVITINNTPDFETKNSYTFNVKASDPSGQFNTEAVTLAVNDLPPVITSATTANINEGVAGGTPVYTAVAADPGGGTVTYSLTGTDAAAFTINSATGVVTISNTPDFETKASYNFTVKASDPSGQFNTEAVTLAVNDLPPVISSAATASVNEGVVANSVVYTAIAADPGGGTVTYSLTGTDAAAFSINATTGVITINNTPDFETKASYSFTVKASDPSGQFNTEAVTLAVNDLPPVITSATTANVNEGVAGGTPVYTAIAADPGGGTVTYSLTGTDAGAFSINAATGVVTINSTPDFETKASYTFTVKASDPSGQLNTEAVTVTVNDLPPVISSVATANVNEGVAAGTPVYTAIAADPGGGTVTYSLTGADAAAFTINSATGVVTINNTPDFETKAAYNFTVKASDPSGMFNTEAVTLAVNDLPPVISSATAANVNEGVAAGAAVYTVVAADPGGGAVTYSLTGADAAAFSINAATGVVTINNTPDFETKPSYSFTVKASDPSGASNTEAVTVTVNDLPPVAISSATAANVNEGVAAGTAVYTAVAADPGGGAVIYSLTGTDAAAFSINATTGVVAINNTPDFETKASYSFTVKASDPSGQFNTEAVTLSVNDLPPVISSAATANVNEGVAAGTAVYTAIAADPVGGAVIYSLTGSDASAFSINATTGVFAINNTPEFDTKSSYSLTVKASDPSGQFNTEAVTSLSVQ